MDTEQTEVAASTKTCIVMNIEPDTNHDELKEFTPSSHP
jgi:hypothetical protein